MKGFKYLLIAALFAACTSTPQENLIYVTLDEAAGLAQGAPVVAKGIAIGTVKELSIHGSGVVVSIALNAGTEITANSIFGVQTSATPISVEVTLSEGTAMLANGDTTKGQILRKVDEFTQFTNDTWLDFAKEMVNQAEQVVETYKRESSVDDQIRAAAYDSLTFYWNHDQVVRITEVMDISYKGNTLHRNYFFLGNDMVVITFPDLKAKPNPEATGLREPFYKIFMQGYEVKLALGPDDTPLVPGSRVYDKVRDYYPDHVQSLVARSISAAGNPS
jgi:hypothetical protein